MLATRSETEPTLADFAVCLGCRAPLRGRDACLTCGRSYPMRDQILEAIGPLEGRNRINAAFYDGPGWVRFRKWERLFLTLQGGARRARMQILRHVLAIDRPGVRALEVGIGDGDNLAYLPESWDVYGVDVARTQLVACQERHPRMKGRLAWAEGENLPFADETFDVCYAIGGFTYFNDHAAALREMRRVTKAGGPVVVADETPGMHRAGIGHLIGVPAIDAFWLRGLGLDREFVEMALQYDVDPESVARATWPSASSRKIWSRLGYCLVHPGIEASG
ncbi:MAG: class I SAM-dependent methyltransferase [Paludisphaera borealis]|uniref:class I SAM-dependent methyltransferase n=1 Tax=Paludisphaera borealis TaxID=1387353 RepID=UPI00284B6E2A|nr:class I SAM-dependent methyltransferase [Paludisphaera borealis]MDR3620444.1 class I SAM-dependent methyltransferase [Paludisphaera borealis]